MEDDNASRIGWGAMLAGDPLDRDDWQEALKQQSDPLHPWVTETEARSDPSLTSAGQRGHGEHGLRAR